MWNYAQLHDCRHQFLLKYFSEIVENKCGYSDEKVILLKKVEYKTFAIEVVQGTFEASGVKV